MSRLREFIRDLPVVGRPAAWLYHIVSGPRRVMKLEQQVMKLEQQVWAEIRRAHDRLDVLRANQRNIALTIPEVLSASLDGPIPAQPRDLHTRSRLCTQEQFTTPEYRYWCARMRERPVWHRSLWEYSYVAQVLWERGMLAEGKHGCGFGVGQEPLPALFAAAGCDVLATDAPHGEIATGWHGAGQYADSVEALKHKEIVDAAVFRDRVRFRHADMNAPPADLGAFDFVWSCCAMEHLGTLDNGLKFLRNACRFLVAGGIAVHTTEFNLTSATDTIESGGIVIFRQRDIEQAKEELQDAGCELVSVNYDPGNQLLDRFVAVPPYNPGERDIPHLRLMIERYVSTSIGLIVRKRAP